jgi:hypothetical protein
MYQLMHSNPTMKSFTSSPHAYIAAVIGLLAVVQRPESVHALQVMISYPNSTCADDGLSISGTYELSYDEYAYADEGFSVDYYGTCMYFEGGYFNLSAVDEYVDPSDYILSGVCSQCSSDLAICLDPYDDATTACSEAKQQQQYQQYQSNAYQSTLALLQSNAYQSTLGGSASSSSSSSLATDPVMQFSLATRQIVNDNQAVRFGQQSIAGYYMLGALICLATLASLVMLAEKKRQRKPHSETMVELSQKLPVMEKIVVV